MARRIGALIGMAVIIALAALLVWRVYQHHLVSNQEDEVVIVSGAAPSFLAPS